MSRTLAWLAPHETDLPTIFDQYIKEVQGLPIGSERLLWGRKILQEKDIVLEATNQRFRDQIFEACWTIERFVESAS